MQSTFTLVGLTDLGNATGVNLTGVRCGNTAPVVDHYRYGAVKFIGANDIGPDYTVTFPLVSIKPNKALSLIGNTWGTIDLEGVVVFDGTLGTCGTAVVSLPESPVPIG